MASVQCPSAIFQFGPFFTSSLCCFICGYWHWIQGNIFFFIRETPWVKILEIRVYPPLNASSLIHFNSPLSISAVIGESHTLERQQAAMFCPLNVQASVNVLRLKPITFNILQLREHFGCFMWTFSRCELGNQFKQTSFAHCGSTNA